jgi:hypothetical protein
MKLVIDTTDSENVTLQCAEFDSYELGLALGKYLEHIADLAGADAETLKKTAVQSMTIAMLNSADEADIKMSRQWRRVSDDR